jgi:hypothetical protein
MVVIICLATVVVIRSRAVLPGKKACTTTRAAFTAAGTPIQINEAYGDNLEGVVKDGEEGILRYPLLNSPQGRRIATNLFVEYYEYIR